MEGLTIISVGHRPELEQFHTRKLTLERKQGGAKLVSDILLVKHPEQPRLIKRFLRGNKQSRTSGVIIASLQATTMPRIVFHARGKRCSTSVTGIVIGIFSRETGMRKSPGFYETFSPCR